VAQPTPEPLPPDEDETAAADADEDPFAGPSGGGPYDPERAFFGPVPRLRSEDGNYSFGIGGLMQFDAGKHFQNSQGGNATTQSLVPDFNDGTNARRIILGVNGTVFSDWIYAFSYDFTNTGADGILGALLVYRGLSPVWLFLGQQSNSVGLEASTFSSQRTFMEASLQSTFPFAPGTPALGISALHRGSNHYVRGGFYGEPIDESGNSDEGWGIHGRAAWAPVAERTRALHIGASGYWRTPTTIRGEDNVGNTTALDFDTDIELDIDGRSVVDTGNIAAVDSYYFAGLESALVLGPFSLQGEYGRVGVVRDDDRLTDLNFDGYYVYGSYFLTGESRNYFPRFGAFWRVDPHQPFSLSRGTWGAWEVGARYSFIDLDDEVNDLAAGGIRGGIGRSFTFGVNWYLNAFVRLMLNYVHTDVDNLSDEGLSEGTVVDAVGLRLQMEW